MALDPLHLHIVNFAVDIWESQRPRLPDGRAGGHDLDPKIPVSFRTEQFHIPQMIHSWASFLENAQLQRRKSNKSLKYCSELQAWSKYADLFYSAYPLILHDPKAALQTLATKAPSCFWYFFWFWSSECPSECFLRYMCSEVVPQLCSEPLQKEVCKKELERIKVCSEVVPQLCSEPLQKEVCKKELERIKGWLKSYQKSSMGMTMGLEATGLSHDIPPAYLLASSPTG